MRTLLIGLIFVVLANPALAQKRIALLIGNQDYAAEVGRLKNPINDVNLIASSLRQIGFAPVDIKIVKDANRRQVLRAVNHHAKALKAAGPEAIGFFYYSGHGAANKQDKRNYLIPVGVKRLDPDVWYDAVPLERIVSTLSTLAANAAHFVVFDACRNLLNARTRGSKGFVPVSARRGMLIAFSTDPGDTASDAGSSSGPYAAALAAELKQPGVNHLDLFQNIKERVYKYTKVQVPWTRDGRLERVYLGRQTADKSKQTNLRAAWLTTKELGSCSAYSTFRNSFPKTYYAKLADNELRRLKCPRTNRRQTDIKSSGQLGFSKSEICSNWKRCSEIAGGNRRSFCGDIPGFCL